MKAHNIFGIIILVIVFSIIGKMDIENEIMIEDVKKTVDENGSWEKKYIENVCSGKWVDTENLQPKCSNGLRVYEGE